MRDSDGAAAVGAQLAAVARWLNAAATVDIDPATATLVRLAGGNSNETYRLSDGDRSWLVRRPPAHALDASAHSMSREWILLQAVYGSDVPCAAPIAYCSDHSVIGADFLVTEFIADAVSILDVLPPAYPSSEQALPVIGRALMDALVAVQAVDWRASGLAEFGRPQGFLDRQLPRWEHRFRRDQVREIPAFETVTAWLKEHRPPPQPAALMHGDFHLDNCLFAMAKPRLRAIIDWELATIGDPLVDLGLCLAFWGPRAATSLAMPTVQAVSRMPGTPSRAALAARYAERTGRDLEHLVWYQVFALWKLAVIVESAYGQHIRGDLRTEYAAALEHDVPALFAEAASQAEEIPPIM